MSYNHQNKYLNPQIPQLTKKSLSADPKYYNIGEIGLYQEFKNQYDKLKTSYDLKDKEVDELTRTIKKLEMQVMNSKQQFYQREIRRLKGDVQKYQEENQDNKHKYLVSENIKREMEATVKVKSQQVKTLLKQIQKQKILTAQLKHQNTEKDKKFSFVLAQLEKSNRSTAQKYEQINTKHNKLESQYRIKMQELQKSHKNEEKYHKKLEQAETIIKNNKKLSQEKQAESYKSIIALENQLRQLKMKSKEQIQLLKSQNQILSSKRKNQELLSLERVQTANSFKTHRQMELQIISLEQEIRKYKLQAQDKNKIIQQLRKQQKDIMNSSQIKMLQLKSNNLEIEKHKIKKEYQLKINALQEEIQKLKLKEFINPAENNKNFQELLRSQIQENAKVKRQLAFKIDQTFNLKSDLEEEKLKIKHLESQIDILKRKQKAQEKNHKIDTQIIIQNIKNDYQTLKRKLQVNQNKFQAKLREIKEKDNFIISTIVGRSRQEDIPIIMAQLQRIFEADYSTQLIEAHQQIKYLNSLLKDQS